jgi:hypothetical protein
MEEARSTQLLELNTDKNSADLMQTINCPGGSGIRRNQLSQRMVWFFIGFGLFLGSVRSIEYGSGQMV